MLKRFVSSLVAFFWLNCELRHCLMLQVRWAIRKDGLDVLFPSLRFFPQLWLVFYVARSTAQKKLLLLLCASLDRYVNFRTGGKFICINNFPKRRARSQFSQQWADWRVQKRLQLHGYSHDQREAGGGGDGRGGDGGGGGGGGGMVYMARRYNSMHAYTSSFTASYEEKTSKSGLLV